MVKQLEMPIEIIGCPILREPNGLAMSSRNERLSREDRAKAGIISETLFMIRDKRNSLSVPELKMAGLKQLSKVPEIQPEYLEIADPDTLQPIEKLEQNQQAVVCIAVKLGDVRLIDNVLI